MGGGETKSEDKNPEPTTAEEKALKVDAGEKRANAEAKRGDAVTKREAAAEARTHAEAKRGEAGEVGAEAATLDAEANEKKEAYIVNVCIDGMDMERGDADKKAEGYLTEETPAKPPPGAVQKYLAPWLAARGAEKKKKALEAEAGEKEAEATTLDAEADALDEAATALDKEAEAVSGNLAALVQERLSADEETTERRRVAGVVKGVVGEWYGAGKGGGGGDDDVVFLAETVVGQLAKMRQEMEQMMAENEGKFTFFNTY